MDVASAGWIFELRNQLSPSDLALIENCQSNGSEIPSQIGLPSPAFHHRDLQDEYLIWCPHELPQGTSVAIASSRLSQKLDEQSGWFDALRTIAVQISREQKFLIASAGTTANDFVRRISELFEIPLVEFKPFPDNPTNDWFNRILSVTGGENSQSSEPDANPTDAQATIYFKLRDDLALDKRRPNVDDLLVRSAVTTFLLSVRKGGNIANAAQQRLICPSKPATRLLIDRRLTPKTVETSLLDNGATAWWVYDSPETKTSSVPAPAIHSTCRILSADELANDNYLIHYTRRRVGPWPDQAKPEFLDDLIFQTGRRKHNELASLCRILASKRILATNCLTRDRRPVVCFSDIPLNQISQHRVFRRHLSRWDFEPFGIAFDRLLLEKIGARPVIYGTQQDWDELPNEDRPFFQLEQSKSEKIDWRSEREWRKTGDLVLDQIPHDQAVVFVKTESDAQWVDALSRWPVVVLSPGDQPVPYALHQTWGIISFCLTKLFLSQLSTRWTAIASN